MKRIIPFVHDLIGEHLQKDMIAVDATAGNGHDTLMLAKKCQCVYAFDIQEEAIIATSKRLKKHGIHHVKLIHDSHAFIDQYIDKPIDVVIFNLGYLPGFSHDIKTDKTTTLIALEKILSMLNKGGICALTVYTAHEGGQEEALAIEAYLKEIDSKVFDVLKYQMINKKASPYNLVIKKKE